MFVCLMFWFGKAAILSGAEGCGGAGNGVCDEQGGATASVAADHVRGFYSVLVRAHHAPGLLGDLQKPPIVGISHQTPHSKQVI